jgi:hypothetical protein
MNVMQTLMGASPGTQHKAYAAALTLPLLKPVSNMQCHAADGLANDRAVCFLKRLKSLTRCGCPEQTPAVAMNAQHCFRLPSAFVIDHASSGMTLKC